LNNELLSMRSSLAMSQERMMKQIWTQDAEIANLRGTIAGLEATQAQWEERYRRQREVITYLEAMRAQWEATREEWEATQAQWEERDRRQREAITYLKEVYIPWKNTYITSLETQLRDLLSGRLVRAILSVSSLPGKLIRRLRHH
jgi:chromosome segregation ATPase